MFLLDLLFNTSRMKQKTMLLKKSLGKQHIAELNSACRAICRDKSLPELWHESSGVQNTEQTGCSHDVQCAVV